MTRNDYLIWSSFLMQFTIINAKKKWVNVVSVDEVFLMRCIILVEIMYLAIENRRLNMFKI